MTTIPPTSAGVPLAEVGRIAARADVRKAGGRVGGLQPMPELHAEQYDSLRQDIVLHGVLVPVVQDQHGRVVDGHNRTAIAAELGIDCPVETMTVTEDEAADLAVTLNCARRHLSREQTRQIVGGEIARRPGDSDRAIARRVGCHHSTVSSVRRGSVANLATDANDVVLDAGEAEKLTDEILESLRPVFTHVVNEIYCARSNKISAAEIAGALTIAMHRTEAATPEYMASFVRGCIYNPLINYVLTDVSDDPYRQQWDHETFLPLTDEDRQWQLDCITYAVALRTGAEVPR